MYKNRDYIKDDQKLKNEIKRIGEKGAALSLI